MRAWLELQRARRRRGRAVGCFARRAWMTLGEAEQAPCREHVELPCFSEHEPNSETVRERTLRMASIEA